MYKTYDMRAFADELDKVSDNGDARALSKAIKACWTASSESVDLEMVADHFYDLRCLALDLSVTPQQTKGPATQGAQAAFLSAVILYCRVAEVNSQNRSAGNYKALLSPELREQHNIVADYRNNGLAHWGPGGDGPTLNDTQFVLRVGEDGSEEFLFPHKYANYLVKVVYALQRVVPAVGELVMQRLNDKKAEVQSRLKRLRERSPEIMINLESKTFDYYSYYPTREMAEGFLNNSHAPGITFHQTLPPRFVR